MSHWPFVPWSHHEAQWSHAQSCRRLMQVSVVCRVSGSKEWHETGAGKCRQTTRLYFVLECCQCNSALKQQCKQVE